MKAKQKKRSENLRARELILDYQYYVIPKAVMEDEALNPSDKEVYGYLLSCIQPKGGGRCFPSIRTIGEALKLSYKTVVTSRKRLRKAGWIDWDFVSGRSNEYWLIQEKISPTNNMLSSTLTTSGSKAVAKLDEDTVTEVNAIITAYDNGRKTLLPRNPPPFRWSSKQIAQAIEFIEVCNDIEFAQQVILFVFKYWDDLAHKWKITEFKVPTPAMILNYTEDMLDALWLIYNTRDQQEKEVIIQGLVG